MTLDDVIERLDDQQTLADIIYKYFYNGPLAGAKYRLAKIIKRYALGEQLLTLSEILDEFCETLSGTDYIINETVFINDIEEIIPKTIELNPSIIRGLYWKQLNGADDNTIIVDKFNLFKKKYE